MSTNTPPAVCRLPDELFSAILMLNKRRAIRERLEQIMLDTKIYSRIIPHFSMRVFFIVNGDHHRHLSYFNGQFTTEIIMFRHGKERFCYGVGMGPEIRYLRDYYDESQ